MSKTVRVQVLMDLCGMTAMLKEGLVASANNLPGHLREPFLASFESDLPEMTRRCAEAVGDLLTEKEVEGLIAFYGSPLGKRLIEVGPELSRRSAIIGNEFAARALDRMFAAHGSDEAEPA